MPAIRVYTSTGWQDVAQQSPAVQVYEQPAAPATPSPGAIWIDTDDLPAAGAQYGPPLVTSLPTVPYDGQEVSLLVDAVNSVVWSLRYRAAVAATGKWEFLGGPPLYSFQSAPSAPTATGTWTSPADWPAIAIPLAGLFGDWLVEAGGRIINQNIRSTPNLSAMMAGFGTSSFSGMVSYNNAADGKSVMMRGKGGGLPPSAFPFRMGYAIYGATPTLADVTYDNLWISLLPWRIGFP